VIPVSITLRVNRILGPGPALALATGLLFSGCSYSAVTGPHSGPAKIGESDTHFFYTKCGLGETLFDIDGSLWQPVGIDLAEERPPAGVGSPDDEGTLTLVAPDRAEFRSSQGRVFVLERRPGDLVTDGC
jgi:hypothetical protein